MNTQTMGFGKESDILSRLEAPMTPAAAQSVLQWKFTDDAVARMNELAEKARQRTLTKQEKAAIDTQERLNNLLGILKSKARQSLKGRPDVSS
jgi:hypothetical protein